jgi:hypothetical protein
MFNRRRRRREQEAIRQEFDQIAATAWNPSPRELTELLREALPDPDPAEPAAETGEGFLPPGMQVSGDQQFEGRMMRHPAPLTIDGTVRTCPVCGVDRDWLVLCVGPDIWLRCRSANETHEPALNSAWYASISGPIQEVFTSKNDGVTKEGFDGIFSGITFPM